MTDIHIRLLFCTSTSPMDKLFLSILFSIYLHFWNFGDFKGGLGFQGHQKQNVEADKATVPGTILVTTNPETFKWFKKKMKTTPTDLIVTVSKIYLHKVLAGKPYVYRRASWATWSWVKMYSLTGRCTLWTLMEPSLVDGLIQTVKSPPRPLRENLQLGQSFTWEPYSPTASLGTLFSSSMNGQR